MLDIKFFTYVYVNSVCDAAIISLAPRESETQTKNEQITVGNFPNRKNHLVISFNVLSLVVTQCSVVYQFSDAR